MTNIKRNSPRPVLHYLGSKWTIAPWVIEHFPAHTTYVEPFGGGAAVLLRKDPSPVEVYNDLDHAVVSFWRVLRARPHDLVTAIEGTPWAREEYLQAWQPCGDELEAARRFFVRSWMNYMGATERPSGWKVNARTKSGHIPLWGREERLLEVAERWRQVQIEHDDALAVIRRFDGPDTLHYCDPPYMPETRSSGTGYACEMDPEAHKEMLDTLLGVKGKVVISGYPNALYTRELEGRGWVRVERESRTRDARAKRIECLWLKIPVFAQR
jgi:DNA adenine methylase